MNYREYSQAAPVIVGCGAVSVLGEKLKEHGCKKALIVTDPGVEKAGAAKKAADALKAAGIEYDIFDKVHADPTDDIVDKCAEMAMSIGADCLVGVGGGSSMDTAKAASILTSGNPGPARKYILGTPIAVDTTTPVFLVPTTTGTGSECTTVAVISIADLSVKWSVFVNTTLAIVDPELALTLPSDITASTGLDALAHATEALTNINWDVHSDLMAEGAIRKIGANLLKSYNEPDNLEARTEMAIAANWAGMAFKNPITHVGHAIGDALGCHFHIAHGLSCCLGLAATMKLVAPVVPDRMLRIAQYMGLNVTGNETGEQLGDIVAGEIYELMRKMKVQSLKSLGYTREQIIPLAKDVTENHLAHYCPVEITMEVAEKLMADVYDNYQ